MPASVHKMCTAVSSRKLVGSSYEVGVSMYNKCHLQVQHAARHCIGGNPIHVFASFYPWIHKSVTSMSTR